MMTNDDVIALAKAKAGDERILEAIHEAKTHRFDTSPRAVAKMKGAGVSETVVAELRRVVAEQAARSTLARAKTALVVDRLAPASANSAATAVDTRQFRDLRANLARWKRFRVMEGSRPADVIITFGPGYAATIRRRETGTLLWSGSSDTWASLLDRMKNEVPPAAPTVCVALWCR